MGWLVLLVAGVRNITQRNQFSYDAETPKKHIPMHVFGDTVHVKTPLEQIWGRFFPKYTFSPWQRSIFHSILTEINGAQPRRKQAPFLWTHWSEPWTLPPEIEWGSEAVWGSSLRGARDGRGGSLHICWPFSGFLMIGDIFFIYFQKTVLWKLDDFSWIALN